MEDRFERVLSLHLKGQMADPTDSGETTVCSIEKCTKMCQVSRTRLGATQLHSIHSKELQSAEYRTVHLSAENDVGVSQCQRENPGMGVSN